VLKGATTGFQPIVSKRLTLPTYLKFKWFRARAKIRPQEFPYSIRSTSRT
jgi:hypothetical protein